MDMACGVCRWRGDLAEREAPYIAWCPGCTTGLTVPPPSRDITSDGVFATETSYGDRLGSRDQWKLEAGARVAWLSRLVPTGASVAEVGAATGEFVQAAEDAGFDVVGIEPSGWAVAHARELTARVFQGTLAEYQAARPHQLFDAVTLFHTLEHLPDPAGLLQEIRRSMRPRGVLLIEVPNVDTVPRNSDGSDWWMSSLADHVHHFRPATLKRLLHEAGFRAKVYGSNMTEYRGRSLTARERARDLVRQKRVIDPKYLLRAEATAPETEAA